MENIKNIENIAKKGVVAKSFMATLDRPEEHGYTGTPDAVCDKLCREWTEVHASRSGVWAFCLTAEGVPHVHMVVQDKNAMRLSELAENYAVGSHFEAVKSGYMAAEDYILKLEEQGEGAEKVLCVKQYGVIV
ncbi:MAG: hypothetical protein ACLUI6_02420 [Butyricicoccus sp.]